jgi:hypothetical protein
MIIGNQLLESLIWFREAYRTPRLPGVVHVDKVTLVIPRESSCPVRGEHGVFLCMRCALLLVPHEWRAALFLAVKAPQPGSGHLPAAVHADTRTRKHRELCGLCTSQGEHTKVEN